MTAVRRRRRQKPAREAALIVLYNVDTRKAFADLQLTKVLAQEELDARDAALAVEIVNGTLRWRGRLDWILAGYVKAGLDTIPAWILNILRMGLYQIFFLDRIPGHAAVDESVKLARRYGHSGTAGLVNAVLRRALKDGPAAYDPFTMIQDPSEALAVATSHPQWLVNRWVERYGEEEARKLLEANNRTPATGIRVNAMRTDRETLRRALADRGVAVEAGAFSRITLRADEGFVPRDVPEFEEGQFFIQDESETLVVELLAPEAGETIVDLCAAPGGKTCHIQETRGSEGFVVAADAQANRLGRIAENLRRMRLEHVGVVCADGRSLALSRPVDRVLVDAPCSGLGVLARRADARWRKTPRSLQNLLGLQAELLRSGANLVRPGGVLVYSVCSNEPEEGSAHVRKFLRENPGFSLEDASGYLPEGLAQEGCLQILPHRHRLDGAFAARMKRIT